jgi:DNA-binding phage protein
MSNMGMNAKVRQTVRDTMRAKDLSTYKLAEQTSMAQPNVARALSGRSGSIPTTWQRILDALGLELVAVPKGTDLSKLEEKGR